MCIRDRAKADAVTGVVVQYGERRVRGVELGLVGQITKDWEVTAGIAQMKTEIAQGSSATQTGQNVEWSPELSATLWSSYKVNSNLSIGAGARYMGKYTNVKSLSNDYIGEVGSNVVVDAMASYKLNKHATLQLNVYNLLDEQYIASLNNNRNRYIPGAPRSANLAANFTF